MGINARMEFVTVERISDHALREADYNLAAVVGSHNFIGEFGKYICLTREEGKRVQVHLMGRYYGEDYARGDLLVYLAVADWIERAFPAALVYYGGDSQETLGLFGAARRAQLYEFWIKSGRELYSRHFCDGGVRGCACCTRSLVNCGGGGGKEFLRCLACGSSFNREHGELMRVKDHFSGEKEDSLYTGF